MPLVLPDVLSPTDLERTRELLGQANWADGRESAGDQARAVKNNQQLPLDSEASQAIGSMVLQNLDRNPAFFSAVLPLRVIPPHINRYAGDTNFYGPHIDGAVRVLPNGQRMRSDLSCTVFLNNPDDYEGGELCVASNSGEQAIKLPAGHAVFYPSTSVHHVRPVTRGERLACFFWIESMVRNTEQRRLLFDLDVNLTSLRQQHGESKETTALVGVYHNLLRQWTQT